MMHRTQILLEKDVYRRAVAEAKAKRLSLGELVRRALVRHLEAEPPARDPVEAALLDDPYDDPRPDKHLSVDADHHLYGAPRKSASKRRRK